MKVTVFDSHHFDRPSLEAANAGRHEIDFLETRLDAKTAILAQGSEAICCFANDYADATTLAELKKIGIRLIALRSAGFNQVDVAAAEILGITVCRVPEYSPYAVAEFAVGLLQTLNRKIHKAHNRVRELNFSLDGLVGFDLHEKTIGVVGAGRIGKVFAQIMRGFGCEVVAYDPKPDLDWAQKNQVQFIPFEELVQRSDVISLHVPLNAQTKHLFDTKTFSLMKKSVYLINTGRGALIESHALVQALKHHAIGGACLDVYEEEATVFFNDLSESGIDDDLLARLLTFPNVLMTSHQAFLTHEALQKIAEVTIESITKFENHEDLGDVLVSSQVK